MQVDAKALGFDDLDNVLRELPLRAKRRVYRSALAFAGTPILRAAKQGTSSGKIRRNTIKKLNKPGSKLGELTLSILTRRAFNPRTKVGDKRLEPYGDKDAFFSVWYEFGKRGFPAQEYLWKAFQSNSKVALQRFVQKMTERIEAEVRKLAKT